MESIFLSEHTYNQYPSSASFHHRLRRHVYILSAALHKGHLELIHLKFVETKKQIKRRFLRTWLSEAENICKIALRSVYRGDKQQLRFLETDFSLWNTNKTGKNVHNWSLFFSKTFWESTTFAFIDRWMQKSQFIIISILHLQLGPSGRICRDFFCLVLASCPRHRSNTQ